MEQQNVDTLKQFYGKKIAIISPHNDDEVLGCWHFMELVSGFSELTLIVVTQHDNDSYLTSKRRQETADALKPFEIFRIVNLGLPDGELNKAANILKKKLMEVLLDIDYVLCPAPNDLTPDHIPISRVVLSLIPHSQIIWYRSTWWTFRMRDADFITTGKIGGKLKAIEKFRTQKHIKLQRSLWLSSLEYLSVKFQPRSAEAFLFATNDRLAPSPFNSISLRYLYRLFYWL